MSGSSFSINHIFRGLRHRNFRLFVSGQLISLIGSWMQQIALSWLVYRMTHSPFLLGIVGFAGQLPTFLIAPVAGLVADRCDRHKFLILTQSLAMLQAVILATLVLTDMITVRQIIVLSAFLGIITAFDTPIRHSFIIHMIDDKEDLSNAIALNSSMFNAARLIGPSVAGIVIAAAGEGICFLVNALSYIAVIASLCRMTIVQETQKRESFRILAELSEGFRYAFHSLPIRSVLMLLALVSLMCVPYQILMPIFAKDIFHGGPEILGFLMAASGLGALCGTIYLASRKNAVGLARMMAWATLMFGAGLTVISFSQNLWFALPVIFFCGFGMMVQMGASNIILQTIVEEDKRGRIMSLYTMAFMGMAPFGSLLAGSLASRIGSPHTLLAGGIICLIGVLIYVRKLPAIRAKIRPIYIRKGLIPEVNTPLQ